MGECASVDSQGCKLAAGETASTVRHLEAAVRCGASPFDHGEWNGRSDQALQGSSAIDSTLADFGRRGNVFGFVADFSACSA